MRKADVFLLFISINILSLALVFAHAAYKKKASIPVMEENAAMVRRLGLTDLCLFTEARYTRNPSMADLNTAFQDHPASLEHFPSGSLIGPPEHIKKVSDYGLD